MSGASFVAQDGATLSGVMAGLGPAIHDFASCEVALEVVDTRPEGGHDGWCVNMGLRPPVDEPHP